MKTIQIHPDDNVLVVVRAGQGSEPPFGHKIAARDISAGEKVVKYGNPIGAATRAIKRGEWVHSHNLATALSGISEYCYNPVAKPNFAAPAKQVFFNGYKRKNGRAGVRNEIFVIPTVGCVNGVARLIASGFEGKGVFAFSHPYGCSQVGDDQDNTRRIIAGLASNPNAAGVLLVGLGCENSGVSSILPLMEEIGNFDRERVKTLICQDFEDEVSEGKRILGELVSLSARDKRQPCGIENLVIGLKCGGSDGLSGITANPAVGAFTDLLVANGGRAVLTEVPEMFGAEHLLMNRAASEPIFRDTVTLINNFKNFFIANNSPIYENPSPGNKDGGITTLEEKSLGCVQKSGKALVGGVLNYGENANKFGSEAESGLFLLYSPGNDLVSSTALAAAGAQIILFTTGRGTPFACPVPTVKISSNTPLACRKPHWIDFDAGVVLDGVSIGNAGADLFEKVIAVASGEKVNGDDTRDMAILKTGVTL